MGELEQSANWGHRSVSLGRTGLFCSPAPHASCALSRGNGLGPVFGPHAVLESDGMVRLMWWPTTRDRAMASEPVPGGHFAAREVENWREATEELAREHVRQLRGG